MKRAIAIFLLALVVIIGWFVVMLRRPAALRVGNPRFNQTAPQMEDHELPSVLRYRSRLAGFEQEVCFGLVLSAADGVPQEVLNLTAIEPELGSTLQEFHTHGGFEIAERLLDPETREKEKATRFEESIDPNELGSTILAPVDLFQDDLLISSRLVLGVEFNYQDHDSESDLAGSLFRRQVVPTGAYTPLPLGPARPPLEGSRRLVDYGVEIGFVILEDLFLDDLPVDFEALRQRIAFFTANEVTDVMPILLQGEAGLAEALRGPLEILQEIKEVWSERKQQQAGLEQASLANEVDGRGVIPAGSLVLTGSPRGTALEIPRGLDRLRLLALGNLTSRGAGVAFAKHCVMYRREMGFLSLGDRVETRVQHLGRQIWTVVP
ncbi:MAG: hypothetical protein P8Y44_10720 [Acidobacteriota bacterium]